jgi:hypothetical protein
MTAIQEQEEQSDVQDDMEFIEAVYEIAFGDDAIIRDFTHKQVLAQLSLYSLRALK